MEATGLGQWDKERQENGHAGTRMQAGTWMQDADTQMRDAGTW